MATLVFGFSVSLENWTYPTHYFPHALLLNWYLSVSESAWKFCYILLGEVYMPEQVTTSEETKTFSCSVWMLRMALT